MTKACVLPKKTSANEARLQRRQTRSQATSGTTRQTGEKGPSAQPTKPVTPAEDEAQPPPEDTVKPPAAPAAHVDTAASPQGPEGRSPAIAEIPALAEHVSPETGSTTDTDYEPRRRCGEPDDVFYRRIGVVAPSS